MFVHPVWAARSSGRVTRCEPSVNRVRRDFLNRFVATGYRTGTHRSPNVRERSAPPNAARHRAASACSAATIGGACAHTALPNAPACRVAKVQLHAKTSRTWTKRPSCCATAIGIARPKLGSRPSKLGCLSIVPGVLVVAAGDGAFGRRPLCQKHVYPTSVSQLSSSRT